MTPSWLDALPILPLAPGVPVVAPTTRAGHHDKGIVAEDDGALYVVLTEYGTRGTVPADVCRIDLGDPQGFGYALRLYTARRAETPLRGARLAIDQPRRAGHSMLDRWVLDQTTDADRLTLALALQEVCP